MDVQTQQRLGEIRKELNSQWNLPKAKNVVGKGEARSYKVITKLHNERNNLKTNGRSAK